jgi:hypothetical protein
MSKFGFGCKILVVIAHFWFIFFNIFFYQNWVPILLVSLEWIMCMKKEQLRTYSIRLLLNAFTMLFFKTTQYVSFLRTPNLDWTLFEFFDVLYEKGMVWYLFNIYAFYLHSNILIHFICKTYPYHDYSYMHLWKLT